MKKTLLFATAVLSLAACSNESDVFAPEETQEISFRTAAHTATRAAITEGRVPTNATIFVSAWQNTAEKYEAYFSSTAFSCTSTDNPQAAWTGGVFWPSTGTLDIMAYCCDPTNPVNPKSAALNGDETNKRVQNLVLDYTGSAANELAGQTDVMWSETARALTKAGGAFNLKFHHALSWVMVNFIKAEGSSASDDAIKLRNIKLNGVCLTGVLTVTPNYEADGSLSATTPYSPVWSNTGTAETVDFPAFKNLEMNFAAAADATSQGLLIIPCAQTSISFEYCTKNGTEADGTTPTYTSWHPYSIDLAAAGANWDAEKKYIYNVSVTTTAIQFTTEVEAWASTTHSETLQ